MVVFLNYKYIHRDFTPRAKSRFVKTVISVNGSCEIALFRNREESSVAIGHEHEKKTRAGD